ncbi:MAG: hypothetical protein H6974_12820 [Gammaproteobacteria bacterium]|nr:hypothetical protein [Gammaproteobacteria bacterium]
MATSAQLATIARQVTFQERVRYYMIEKSLLVLAASPDSADTLLGQKVLDLEESVLAWSLATLTNPSIAAGAHAEDGSTITDGDLQFAVHAQWDAFKV